MRVATGGLLMLNRRLVAAALALCTFPAGGCQSITTCSDSCGRGGSMAFQKYDCSCDGVCGQCCGGTAGCDDKCGCDSACGGCDGACDSACEGGPLRRLLGCMSCTGCGECYWNEWHNDPPSLCEPCNRCGQYVGAGNMGYYRAPYRHDGFVAKDSSNVSPLDIADLPTDDAEEETLR
jgi:hypothetical protein